MDLHGFLQGLGAEHRLLGGNTLGELAAWLWGPPLVALLGGQAVRSDAQRGGLTVKIHLPLTTRQLQ